MTSAVILDVVAASDQHAARPLRGVQVALGVAHRDVGRRERRARHEQLHGLLRRHEHKVGAGAGQLLCGLGVEQLRHGDEHGAARSGSSQCVRTGAGLDDLDTLIAEQLHEGARSEPVDTGRIEIAAPLLRRRERQHDGRDEDNRADEKGPAQPAATLGEGGRCRAAGLGDGHRGGSLLDATRPRVEPIDAGCRCVERVASTSTRSCTSSSAVAEWWP